MTTEPTIEEVDIDGMCAHLAQTSVEFALLFGSHARGTASDDSDVDVTLRFPEEIDAYERFRRRNRIDAKLQEYTENFVDVSDIATLPIPVAYTALRDGILLAGEESAVIAYREPIEQEYEATKDERAQARQALIDPLASGDV